MRKKILFTFIILLNLVGLSFIFAQENTQTQNDGGEQVISSGTDNDLTGLDELDDLGDLDNLDEDLGQDVGGEETGDNVEGITNWGYTENDKIIVKEVGTDYVVLEAPVVVLKDGTKIKQYKVYYSTKSLADNLDATQVMSKTFTFDEITGDKIDLRIDGLSPNTTYYAVVVPVNSDDVEGEPSKEISFTTKEEKVEEQHPAPEVKIENVTYVVSGDKLTIKWSPVKGADKIEIYFKSINDSDYKKVTSVDSSVTSYTINVTKPGKYQVKLTPVNKEGVPVGKDYILTVDVKEVVKKTIKKAPKVGPETTVLLIMLLIASFAYILVRYRKS